MNNREMSDILLGAFLGSVGLCFILVLLNCSPKQIEQNMQKEAISHGAAHYEVDTNGVVYFKWNK